MRISFISKVLIIFMCYFMFGCANYQPSKTKSKLTEADILKNEVYDSDSSIDIRCLPLIEKKVAQQYLGINPKSSEMLPVLVDITNKTDTVLKINLDKSYLLSSDSKRCDNLPIEDAINKALRSDTELLGWQIGFGIVGWSIAAENLTSTNRTLEEDYHAKSFKPTMINSGSSGKGVVFFVVDDKLFSSVDYLVINYKSLETEMDNIIKIAIPNNF